MGPRRVGGGRWCVRALARTALFVVAPGVCVFGCGNSDGDGGSGNVELGAAKPLVDAWCGAIRNCCVKAGFPASPLADCESELKRQTDVVAGLASGDILAVEPAFSQCVEAFRTIGTTCTGDISLFAPCGSAWSGTTPPGGSCEDVSSCTRNGPTACIKTNSADIGVCTTLTRGSLGDPCILSVNEFQSGITYGTFEATLPAVYCDASDGLYCPFESEICSAIPAVGQACELECVPGSGCVDGLCVTTKALGAACTDSAECASAYCGSGGVCEARPFANDDLCAGDNN